jgi:hypothetical protein
MYRGEAHKVKLVLIPDFIFRAHEANLAYLLFSSSSGRLEKSGTGGRLRQYNQKIKRLSQLGKRSPVHATVKRIISFSYTGYSDSGPIPPPI